MKRASWTLRLLGVLALLVTLLIGSSGASRAQGDSHTFPETGHTVSGQFWQYWQQHGGLAQQGYPISEEMQEKSDLNGQTYTVQYFERAVFEKHPENQPPFDVLLSQLGTFLYKAKYGEAGAPNQKVSTDNPRVFTESGHSLGGKFRTYWEQQGGLAQQGYPISDEFTEVSDLNGQSYTVQYFERAVFELHPENGGTPYEVLLSQLGTFQHKAKYEQPAPPPEPPQPPQPPQPPTPPGPCEGIPASQNQTVTPNCGPRGTDFTFEGWGFQPGEMVGVYATGPSGEVVGAPFQVPADGKGRVSGVGLRTTSESDLGIWAFTMEGTTSHAKAIGYFKVTDTAPAPPTSGCDTSGNKDGSATPSEVRPGQTTQIRATGFQPGEAVSYWVTTPAGDVVGTHAPATGLVKSDGSIGPIELPIDSSFTVGRWAITFQGASSGHQSVIYFCVGQ